MLSATSMGSGFGIAAETALLVGGRSDVDIGALVVRGAGKENDTQGALTAEGAFGGEDGGSESSKLTLNTLEKICKR